jgi:hypothetical protein
MSGSLIRNIGEQEHCGSLRVFIGKVDSDELISSCDRSFRITYSHWSRINGSLASRFDCSLTSTSLVSTAHGESSIIGERAADQKLFTEDCIPFLKRMALFKAAMLLDDQ